MKKEKKIELAKKELTDLELAQISASGKSNVAIAQSSRALAFAGFRRRR